MGERRRLIFETHATSFDNEAGLASGHHDVELSAAGRRQAMELGRRHTADPPARILTSDLQRAWATAEIAFGGTVPIVRDRRLRECDYGALTRHPARDLEPLRLKAVGAPFPGGQSYTDCLRQVREVLDELRDDWPGGWVLMIGHRATHYALDVILGGRDLEAVIQAPFAWQPGWAYDLTER